MAAVMLVMGGARIEVLGAVPGCVREATAIDYGTYWPGDSCAVTPKRFPWLGMVFANNPCSARQWLAFNVPNGSEPVVGGKLYLPVVAMSSRTGAARLELHEVVTPVETVMNYTGVVAKVFTDLGDGPLWGAQVVTTNDLRGNDVLARPTSIPIELTPAALSAINAHRGQTLLFGVSVPELESGPDPQSVGLLPTDGFLLLQLASTSAPQAEILQASAQVLAGGSLSLAAAVCGGNAWQGQWLKDGVPLLGATNADLRLYPALPADSGRYQFWASNALGATLSGPTNVTVVPGVVVLYPTIVSAIEGDRVCLSVAFNTLSPAELELRRFGQTVARFSDTYFCLPSIRLEDAGNYDVILHNAAGSVTSSVVVVNVSYRVPILVQTPASEVAAAAGVPLSLDALAVGSSPISYRWLKDGQPLANATSSSLTFSSPTLSDAGNYRVIAFNPGGSVTSTVTRLTVSPAVLRGPYEGEAYVGTDFALFTEIVSIPETAVQWYRNDVLLPGETNSFLLRRPIQLGDAGTYRAVVSNQFGIVVSRNATISVVGRPPTVSIYRVSSEPSEAYVANDVHFGVSAGGGPPPSLQWQRNAVNLPGETNDVLTLRNISAEANGLYRVIASNSFGSVTSNILPIEAISAAPRLSVVPFETNAVAGSMVVFSAVAVGGPPPQYQWQFNGVDLPGETNASLIRPRMRTEDSGEYRIVARNNLGGDSYAWRFEVRPATSLDRWEWQMPKPQGNRLKDIAWVDGRYVAVGLSGKVVTSTDGTNWTTASIDADCELVAVAGGNGRFVALGRIRSVAGVPGGGISQFLAPIVLTSVDGLIWQPSRPAAGFPTEVVDIAFGQGVFVATGMGAFVQSSPDGIHWTPQPLGQRFARRVAFLNGAFWANSWDEVFRSADGVHWEFVTRLPLGGQADFVAQTGGRHVVLGLYGGQGGLISDDGSHWVASFFGQDYVQSLAAGAGRFVSTGYAEDGAIFTSEDGRIWTRRLTGTSRAIESIVFVNERFWSVGEAGTILTSEDGVEWSPSFVANETDYYGLTRHGELLVVAGDDGTILTSSDGRAWSRQATPSGRNLHAVQSGGGLLVAGGRGGRIMTSPDGTNWTTRSSGTTNYVERLAWGNGRWVGVCENSDVITSTNGIVWTSARLELLGRPPTGYEGITYGDGYWMVVGGFQESFAVGTVFVSTNAQQWVNLDPADGLDGKRYRDVAFAEGRFVVVGNDGRVTVFVRSGDPHLERPFAIAASYTLAGVSDLIARAENFRRVVFANGRFVVVGNNGVIFSSANPTRPDSWVQHRSRTSLNVHDILGTPQDTYYAVGNNGMILRSGASALRFTDIRRAGGNVVLEFDAAGEPGPFQFETSLDMQTWSPTAAPVTSPMTVPWLPDAGQFFRLRSR